MAEIFTDLRHRCFRRMSPLVAAVSPTAKKIRLTNRLKGLGRCVMVPVVRRVDDREGPTRGTALDCVSADGHADNSKFPRLRQSRCG